MAKATITNSNDGLFDDSVFIVLSDCSWFIFFGDKEYQQFCSLSRIIIPGYCMQTVAILIKAVALFVDMMFALKN
jgi:hypothetical protein